MVSRREFCQGLAVLATGPIAWRKVLARELAESRFPEATNLLTAAVQSGLVDSACMYLRRGSHTTEEAFGQASSPAAMYLLGSISKPICLVPILAAIDQGEVRLDDSAQKYLPRFQGEGREQVLIRHLLTHVSGLPDQVADNQQLRARQAPLSEFVAAAERTPVQFRPGSQYQYSSMGTLLAARISEVVSGQSILKLVNEGVLARLSLKNSTLGAGKFAVNDLVPVQTKFAAPEAGAGDPAAKSWDWNSDYWRRLGAPWGGVHASARDVAMFLEDFISPDGKLLSRSFAAEVIRNQNPSGLESRGFGFDVGGSFAGAGASEKTFGHTGSTGTIAWLDPESQTTCVVLTSLPARAVANHPRMQVSQLMATSAGTR